jgi:hypothetical protein
VVWYAEIMLEGQLSEPTFLSELERAVRDHELAIYGTDEATAWVWKEYRPEISGERHRVAVTTTGYFGTLIDGDELKLAAEAAVFRHGDELHGTRLEVGIAEPQKVGTDRAVRRWSKTVASRQIVAFLLGFLVLGWETGIEPATSGATDRRSTS